MAHPAVPACYSLEFRSAKQVYLEDLSSNATGTRNSIRHDEVIRGQAWYNTGLRPIIIWLLSSGDTVAYSRLAVLALHGYKDEHIRYEMSPK